MAQPRLSVRKVREILRLHHEQALPARQIAAGVGCALSTVQECLRRAAAAGVGWPLPAQWDEASLESRLYPPAMPVVDYPLPDFARIQAELAKKGVTRWLLWSEYKAAHLDGLQYTAFCNHYRRWLSRQSAVLRQAHAPGDKLFVDYAGPTVGIVDRRTGEVRPAQIFVAVLGCSNYTFAEATWTQAVPDWLGSHVRALAFIEGIPAAIGRNTGPASPESAAPRATPARPRPVPAAVRPCPRAPPGSPGPHPATPPPAQTPIPPSASGAVRARSITADAAN